MTEMNAFPGGASFDQALHERFARFQESVRLIGSFVDSTKKSVDDLLKHHLELSAIVGEGLTEADQPESEDDVPGDASADPAIPFSSEQLRYMAGLVDEQIARVTRYPEILFEMAFIYYLAAFEAYLQDVVELTLLRKPDILKSKKQLSEEKVITHVQYGSLLKTLAQREIGELGYRSFLEQAEYYRDKFKLDLGATADLDQLAEFHARRNLYVHNGGVVNAKYRDTVPEPHVSVGQRLQITNDYWNEAREALMRVATHVRDHLVRKYGEKPSRATGA